MTSSSAAAGAGSGNRPVIGLSTYREQARWGAWATSADLLNSEYAQSVETAGGVPVLLPPQDPSGAESVVDRLDGLVISGGADVDPALYRADPHPRTAGWRPDRDAWEWALLDAAAARGLPVLGVCRGLQLMAVWAGGTLRQHVPDAVGHEDHSPGPDTYGTTTVVVDSRTRLAGLMGTGATVACHHHQCVEEHPGLTVAARAADGTPEAFEDPMRPFWIGVQWHPETAADRGLFAGLVASARHR